MKNQGLPFSTIVLAVISVLILVLIVFFVTGSFPRLVGPIPQYIEETRKIRTQCSIWLEDISQRLTMARYPRVFDIENAFINSEYCSRTFKLENKNVHCYSAEIGVHGRFTVYTDAGTPVTCYSNTDGCFCS
ncbi:MAG: hypothetical protein QXQ19_01855 [Candidatus Aenigmatarchaeota archaeon]